MCNVYHGTVSETKVYHYCYPDGRPVTKYHLNSIIKAEMQNLGFNPEGFTTHSLRAGAATTANQVGFNEEDIKSLGHWSSSAYQTYVHQSYTHRFQFAKRLSQQVL